MSRLTRKPYEALTSAQQEVFDQIVENRPVKPKDGHIGGPFDIWLRVPEMGRRTVGLGGFYRFRTGVDRRYIELAILVTGAHWQAQFEWYAHEPMAVEAGVPQDVIDAYTNAANYKVAEVTTAATYRLAEAGVVYARQLLQGFANGWRERALQRLARQNRNGLGQTLSR